MDVIMGFHKVSGALKKEVLRRDSEISRTEPEPSLIF